MVVKMISALLVDEHPVWVIHKPFRGAEVNLRSQSARVVTGYRHTGWHSSLAIYTCRALGRDIRDEHQEYTKTTVDKHLEGWLVHSAKRKCRMRVEAEKSRENWGEEHHQ